MPRGRTHTTIIQRLAKLAQGSPAAAKFLTDPDLKADRGSCARHLKALIAEFGQPEELMLTLDVA